jgi:hypothetical protein
MLHLGCIMAWIVLCQGKPLALKKGLVMGSLLIVTIQAMMHPRCGVGSALA